MPKLRVLDESPPMARGTGEEQLRELRSYLKRCVEELRYLLTRRLDRENLSAKLLEELEAGGTAAEISYDGASSGLEAETVQAALDELAAEGGGEYEARVSELDFSNIDAGFFSVTWEDGVTNDYTVTRDGSGRITSVTNTADGFTTEVIWE